MSKEDIIKNALERVIMNGHFEDIPAYFSENYIAHAEEKKYSGHTFIKQFVSQVRAAIPDISLKKIDFLATDENKIVWQRTFRGTHKFSMMGIPPSGKKINWSEMVVSRFEDDKIAEEWVVSNLAGQLMFKLSERN